MDGPPAQVRLSIAWCALNALNNPHARLLCVPTPRPVGRPARQECVSKGVERHCPHSQLPEIKTL